MCVPFLVLLFYVRSRDIEINVYDLMLLCIRYIYLQQNNGYSNGKLCAENVSK